MNRNRAISKLLDAKDPGEIKLWADKIYERFPCLPVWTVGAFFSGVLTVGQAVPRFLVPDDAWGFWITRLKISHQSGTLTASTKINVSVVYSNLTTLLGTLTLTSAAVADTVYLVELVEPFALKGGDLVKWDCTAIGGHAAVTACVEGWQAS